MTDQLTYAEHKGIEEKNFRDRVVLSVERAYQRVFSGQGDANDGLIVARDIAMMAGLAQWSPVTGDGSSGVDVGHVTVMRAGAQQLAFNIMRKARIVLQPAVAREVPQKRQYRADQPARFIEPDDTPPPPQPQPGG